MIATARVVARLVAQGLVRVPAGFRRHPAELHAPVPLRLQVRRTLVQEEALDADTSVLAGRLAMGLEAVRTASRPAVKTGPNEGFPVPLLVHAVADEVRVLVSTPPVEEALARRLVADDVLATGRVADTGPSKLTAAT